MIAFNTHAFAVVKDEHVEIHPAAISLGGGRCNLERVEQTLEVARIVCPHTSLCEHCHILFDVT